MGDSVSAVNHFEESVEFLMKLPMDDLEVLAHSFFFCYILIGSVLPFVNSDC